MKIGLAAVIVKIKVVYFFPRHRVILQYIGLYACECDGQFYEFDQGEFFPASPPKLSSMDDTGYVYVPSGCTSAKTGNCFRFYPIMYSGLLCLD